MSKHTLFSDSKFMQEYSKALVQAETIVNDHTTTGENNITSISGMYPHGSQDLTFMLYTKICRVLGYETQGNHTLMLHEAEDIINYAAFLVVKLKEEAVDKREN